MIIAPISIDEKPQSFCTPPRAEDIFARDVPAKHLFLDRSPGSGAFVTVPLTRMGFDPQLEQFMNVKLPKVGASNPDIVAVEEVSGAIAAIRRVLALNVSELADAFRVSRPTVYAWSDGDAVPSRQNRERIGKILRVARGWEKLTQRSSGDWVRESHEGFSLAELLAADHIDDAEISDRIVARAKAVEIASANRKLSGRELAAKHGFKKISQEEFDQNVSAYTGGA